MSLEQGPWDLNLLCMSTKNQSWPFSLLIFRPLWLLSFSVDKSQLGKFKDDGYALLLAIDNAARGGELAPARSRAGGFGAGRGRRRAVGRGPAEAGRERRTNYR